MKFLYHFGMAIPCDSMEPEDYEDELEFVVELADNDPLVVNYKSAEALMNVAVNAMDTAFAALDLDLKAQIAKRNLLDKGGDA